MKTKRRAVLLPGEACDLVRCKDRADWLRARGQFIGASDASALLGCSPFKGHTPYSLWAEKRAMLETEQPCQDDNAEEMFWGSFLERVVGNRFCETAGYLGELCEWPLDSCLYRSLKYEWASASIDMWVFDDGEWVPVEIKVIGGLKSGDWGDGPPAGYLAQVQHQMAVTEASHAFIVALLPFPALHIQDWRIERDQPTIDAMMDVEREFYERVRDCIPPPVDGEAVTGQAIAKMRAIWPPQQDVVALPYDAKEHHLELFRLKAEIEGLETQLETHKNWFREQLTNMHATGGFLVGQDSKQKKYQYKQESRTGYLRVGTEFTAALMAAGIRFDETPDSTFMKLYCPRTA